MSSNTIVNGAPMTVLRGTQDLSTRLLPIEPEVLPTHLPKVYMYAQRGPVGPQLVVGNSRNQMYGDDTFDLRKKYATHQTVLSNIVNAKGNAQMIERIVPNDVGPMSNLLLSLDVVANDLPVYTIDANGKRVLDTNGLPIPTGATTSGFIAKWVLSTNDGTGPVGFGEATQVVGDQIGALAAVSKRYPIIELQASSYGEIFNNSGIRLWAPDVDNATPVNTKAMTATGTYPFRLAAIRRSSPTATPSIVATEFAEPFFDFCLKANQLNPLTDAQYSLGDIFLNKYQNLSDIRFPLKYGDFGRIHIYQNYIDKIVTDAVTLEKAYGSNLHDLSLTNTPAAITAEKYLFNFVSGKNSNGAPYNTFAMNTGDANAIRLSENTNLFAASGSDGTMNDDLFATLVADRVAEYANPNSYLMDTAVHTESIIYDTGFPIATKYALCKFISERKDTAVVLSTYTVDSNATPGSSNMSASDEHSIAVALRTRLQMYPESDYFGTAVMRGMIIGRYGNLRNSQFTRKLPLTIEIASKAAEMMGAGDGRWKEVSLFDRAPNSEVTMFDNVNVTFTPAAVRNKDWEVGLNWVQAFSRKSLFFPALKTVYDNDTSVLNSFFTMMACVELQKVGERVWRLYSGSVSLTNGQLIDRVNSSVEERSVGRFANMFKVVPAAYLTDADLARGYSWTLPIKLYANNLKSVMTLSLQAYRMTDYTATA